jgi:GT2 family glycosyltransferase
MVGAMELLSWSAAVLGVAAGLSLLRGLYAVGEALSMRRKLAAGLGPPPEGPRPKAAVLLPMRGLDADLPASLAGLLRQDYPDYEVVFILESPDDPAAAAVREALARLPEGQRSSGLTRTETVFAGPCVDCGQKVHNLLAGLGRVSADTEVLAFIDSDARPGPDWLARLVTPLHGADRSVAVSTGYRWYLPVEGGPLSASALLSAWNAGLAMMFSADNAPFAWGGSMALRREDFDRLKVREHWAGSVSDDGSLTRAVRADGRRIAFAPALLVPTLHDATWAGLLEFVRRQFLIVRVYGGKAWAAGLVFTVIHAAAVFAAPAVAALRGEWDALGTWLVAGPAASLLVGVLLGRLRLAMAVRLFPQHRSAVARTALALLFGGPALTLLNLVTLTAAGVSRRIDWRGIGYTLHGPNRLTIHRG